MDRLDKALLWYRQLLAKERAIWEADDTTDDEHCLAGERYKVTVFAMHRRVEDRRRLYKKAKRLARKGGMVI